MDFSWLDIGSHKTSPVKPTPRNTLIVILIIGSVFALVIGGLWLPIGIRILLLVLAVVIVFLLYLRDLWAISIIGLVTFTLVNRRFILLDRDFNILIVFLFFLLILYLGQLVIYREKVWVYTKLNVFIFIFGVILLIGILNSIFIIRNVPLNALHEPLPYLLPPVVFFIVVNYVKTKSDIETAFKVIFVLLFIDSAFSILSFGLSIGAQGESVYGGFTRVKGHFGNPNVLAGWLELVLPVAIAFLLSSEGKRERLALLFPIIAGYITLILTFSRGGFLLGLGSLGLILIFKVRNKAITVVVLVLFVIAFIFGSGLLIRQLTIFSYEDMLVDASSIHRALQYMNYINTIKKYPIVGIGWGARFDYSTFGEFERSTKTEAKYGHLNSTMFDIGVHNGIIGIIAVYTLFVIIAFFLWRNSKVIRDRRLSLVNWCLALGILSFIAHSFVDGFFKSPKFASHLWVLVGLGFASRLAWDMYGDKINEIGRFRLQIINPFKKRINGNEDKD